MPIDPLDDDSENRKHLRRLMLSYLDVNIDDPQEVRDFKADLGWARENRQRCTSVAGRTMTAIAITVVSVFMGIIIHALGLSEFLSKK